jgi:adenine-specific DNA-methyltransferase
VVYKGEVKMEKMTLASKNLTKDNIKRLIQLFPNCVYEQEINGKLIQVVDFEKLKNELSENIDLEKKERYQMTWPGKSESVLLSNSITTNTLRPIVEESKDFFKTKNIYIEGNNLEVLKVLRETYLGIIDVIYIDPPYNTGNNILYKNDFSIEKENFEIINNDIDGEGKVLTLNRKSEGRFHTKWLNMMYPLLRIARDLLSSEGVIFLAIDDNEYANLKKICDEIFYENNYIGTIVTRSNPQGRGKKNIDPIHEYHLVYAKQVNSMQNLKIMKNGFTGNEYWNFIRGGSNSRKHERPYRFYPMLVKNDEVFMISKEEYKNIFSAENGFDNDFMKELTKKYEKKGYKVIWPIASNGEEKVWQRQFDRSLKEFSTYKYIGKQIKYPLEEFSTPKSLWYDDIHSNVQNGTGYLNKMFDGKNVFDYPKSINTVKDLISAIDAEYVMDFFAGSATTADAVLRLNAQDSGDRKFIMVQLPENLDENLELLAGDSITIKNAIKLCNSMGVDRNIAEVAKERIRRAGKLIKQEFNLSEDFDSGFRVLKLDTSNMEETYHNPAKFEKSHITQTIDNIKPNRTSLDLLFQVMLNLGIVLSSFINTKELNGKKYFDVANGKLIACFDNNLSSEVITHLALLKPDFCVFRDYSFASDAVAINAEQIFKTHSPTTNLRII